MEGYKTTMFVPFIVFIICAMMPTISAAGYAFLIIFAPYSIYLTINKEMIVGTMKSIGKNGGASEIAYEIRKNALRNNKLIPYRALFKLATWIAIVGTLISLIFL